jgi:hypothetical protein
MFSLNLPRVHKKRLPNTRKKTPHLTLEVIIPDLELIGME